MNCICGEKLREIPAVVKGDLTVIRCPLCKRAMGASTWAMAADMWESFLIYKDERKRENERRNNRRRAAHTRGCS